MSIMLTKGTQLNLSKSTNSSKFQIGLGWDLSSARNITGEFDLDGSVCGLEFDLEQNKNVGKDTKYLVFYGTEKTNNIIQSPCGGITHSGDNKSGQGEGDDETITIDFSKIDSKIIELAIIITIYEAKERQQHFGMTNNSYVRVVDTNTNKEVCKYTLNDNYEGATALHVGSLIRVGDVFEFKAVGLGFEADLGQLLTSFGYQV